MLVKEHRQIKQESRDSLESSQFPSNFTVELVCDTFVEHHYALRFI